MRRKIRLKLGFWLYWLHRRVAPFNWGHTIIDTEHCIVCALPLFQLATLADAPNYIAVIRRCRACNIWDIRTEVRT